MDTHFTTKVHEVTDPSDMKAADLRMDPSLYIHEGNWAFCRFDHPYLIGARIGFACGESFNEDRGWSIASPEDETVRNSFCRIEVIAKKGSYLFSHVGKDEDLHLDNSEFSHIMQGNGRELLRVQQYPDMHWKMASAEGDIQVDVIVQPLVFVTLPDNIQKTTTFSMWIAPCRLHGMITIDGEATAVTGTAFLDHPRLTRRKNNPGKFGSYLYTPVMLEDGSFFFSYYSDFIDGKQNDDYFFGYLIDPNLQVSYYRGKSLANLRFTTENQVERAELVFANEHSEIHLSIKEEYFPIRRSSGNGNPTSGKKDYLIYPQLFTADFLRKESPGESRLTGKGLLEYVQSEMREYKTSL